MFVAAMTMEMLKNPTITKIMPHTLIGDAIFSGLFNDANGLQYGVGTEYNDPIEAGCIASTSTVQYNRTALGIAVSPIADAVRGSIKSRPLIIKVKGTNNDPSYLSSSVNEYFDLQGMQFDKNDGRIEYIIMNFSGNSSANRDLDFSSLIPPNSTAEYNVFMTENPFNFIVGDPKFITQTTVYTNDYAYSYEKYKTLNASNIISLPPYSILHVRLLPNLIPRINIESAKLCCNASHTYSVPKELWKEGWHWQIEGLELSNNNPYYVNASDFIGTGKKEVKLLDQNGRLLGSSNIEILACPAKPEIGIDGTYPITTQEFCPNEPMTFNLTIKPGTTLPSALPYSYLWIATGKLANPHGATTAFTPPKTGTDVYLIATDGTCWVKSDAITFQSLIPQVEIVVGTSSNSHTIENGILRVCANRTDDIEFTYLNNDPNWPSGYSINDSWSVCGSPLPSAIITSSQTLDNFCQLNLETVVVGSTMSCTSNTYVNLLTEDCCSSASHSLDPIAGNLMHPNIDELYHYLQTNCSTCSLNYAGTGNARSLEVTNTSSSFVMTINGLFEVDGDLTLNNCNINMGPNALIKLIGNNKLNLVNCIVNECGDNKPWDGIVADDDRQYLSLKGDLVTPFRSTISGAKTAIDLSDNAEFLIANTNFSNNQVNINIHDCSTNIPQRKDAVTSNPFSGYIYGNIFQSDVTRMNLLFGKVNLTQGINLNSLDRVIIGTKEQGLVNNLFSNCENGIISDDASVTYYGNTFNKIHRPATSVNNEFSAAISSKNTSYFNDSRIIIGGQTNSSLPSNKFNDCAVSIDIDGELDLGVTNNYFDVNNSILPDPSNNILDIYIKNTGRSSINIVDNKFEYINTGLHFYNFGSLSTANIYNNEFSNGQPLLNYTDFSNTAIVVNSPNRPYGSYFTVENNSISNLRRGIYAVKQKNLVIKNNFITNLTYSNPDPVKCPTIGIELKYCFDFDVKDNTVASAITPTVGINETLTGIKLSNATTGIVRCNTLTKLGYGLSLKGNCMGTAIRQNTFDEFNSGIYRFSQTTIDNQGSITEPTNNTWSTSVINNARLDADPNNAVVVWYYIGPGTSTDPSFAPIFNPFIYFATECVNPIDPSFCIPDHTSNLRYANIEGSLQYIDSLTYDMDVSYNEKKEVYNLLTNGNFEGKDSIINLESVSSLISEIESGPADELYNIDSLLMCKPDSNLFNYLASIPVSWQGDYYKQQVNRILLKQIEKKPWDAQDSIWLDFIASVPRNVGGDAVVSACAALKKECNEITTSNTQRKKKSELLSSTKELVLFPIPANDFINFEIANSDNNDKIKSIQIIDVLGKASDLLKLTSNNTINVKSLAPGYYKLICTTESNKRYQSNFVKQ